MAEREGQQLGNYRLVRFLGQGGFAEVYLGQHMYLNTEVAIKLLYTRVAQEDIAQFDVLTAVAWSPDGTRIASGCDDKTVQVWQAV